MKHGVLSLVVVAQSEDREAVQALCNDLFAEFRPETSVEVALVEKLAIQLWRERRLAETERRMIDARRENIENDHTDEYGTYGKGENHIASLKSLSLNDQLLIGRYETMISNQISRTLQCLFSLQDKRAKTIDAVIEIPGNMSD